MKRRDTPQPGATIGVARGRFAGPDDLVSAVVEAQRQGLKTQGATPLDVPEVPHSSKYGNTNPAYNQHRNFLA